MFSALRDMQNYMKISYQKILSSFYGDKFKIFEIISGIIVILLSV